MAGSRRAGSFPRPRAGLAAGIPYETPIRPNNYCPPGLVFEDLGSGKPLR